MAVAYPIPLKDETGDSAAYRAPAADLPAPTLQAFRHHKAVAVLALTDPEVRDRCADLDPLAPRRQFEGALSLRRARLLGRCVDVSRHLAFRAEVAMTENLKFLVERYEVRGHSFCLGCSRECWGAVAFGLGASWWAANVTHWEGGGDLASDYALCFLLYLPCRLSISGWLERNGSTRRHLVQQPDVLPRGLSNCLLVSQYSKCRL